MTKLIAPSGSSPQAQVQGRSGLTYTVAADGTINNVNWQDVGPLLSAGWYFATVLTHKVSLNSPLPADLVSIKLAATPANGAISIAAQPPQARKLQVRTVLGTPGTTNITAGTLTLVGLDQDGNAITEVIDLTAGGAASLTQTTKYAYASLTSGTVANYAASGSGTGNTLGIGASNAFGVPTVPGLNATGQFGGLNLACTKASKTTKVLGTSNVTADDVAATAVVDTVARTITPTTAPSASGLTDFELTYSFLAAG